MKTETTEIEINGVKVAMSYDFTAAGEGERGAALLRRSLIYVNRRAGNGVA